MKQTQLERKIFFFVASACTLIPSILSAQKWNATEVTRVTSPRTGDAPFQTVASVAVGTDGDFYVLDRGGNALYGFSRDGAYRWKAEVPAVTNPFLAMMQDTAAMASMKSSFGADSSDIAEMRAEAAARGRAGRAAGSGRAGRVGGDGNGRAGRTGIAGARGRAAGRGATGDVDPFERLAKLNPSASATVNGTVLMLSDGELAVPDAMSRKTTVFDTTGAQIRSDGFFPLMDAPLQMTAVGSWIVGSTRSVMGMLAGMMNGGRDESGYAIKVMPSQSSAMSKEIAHLSMPSPMSFDGKTMKFNVSPPMPLMTSSGDRLFVASNEKYSIDMYDVDGQKIGTIGRTVKRMPLTAAHRMRETRQFAQMMDSIPPRMRQQIRMEPEMSDSLPVITALVAGDSMVLVKRGDFVSKDLPPAANTARWDVLGWDNNYNGYVDLPAGFTPARISGRIYGVLVAKGQKAVAIYTLSAPKPVRRASDISKLH
jgi:hypothetical protein